MTQGLFYTFDISSRTRGQLNIARSYKDSQIQHRPKAAFFQWKNNDMVEQPG